ncbi:MAG: hypothetical protein R6U27_12855 [Desulfobacterales bacterium]
MCAYQVEYVFAFPNGKKEIFNYCFNDNPFQLIPKPIDNPQEWINIEFHQCPDCSLDPRTTRYCPQAANLLPLIYAFDNVRSYDPIHLSVTTNDRKISQDTSVARGISSLMGLIIATCGCPSTRFFIPMGRFHLPLATQEETLFRAAASFLLTQYFLKKSGNPADLNMDGLIKIYYEVQKVNHFMLKRLRSAVKTDSTVNALILLDVYAKFALIDIDECLDEIYYLFQPFLENAMDMEKKGFCQIE